MRSLRYLLLSATLVLCSSARAERVVLPVAIFASGANDSLWATEIRATNGIGSDLAFHVVDFVGVSANLSFAPGDYVVPAGQTRSFGAWDLLSPLFPSKQCGSECGVFLRASYFGAFVIDVDPGLSVQAAILTGTSVVPGTPFGGNFVCNSWEGGYINLNAYEACVQGAGPLLENTGDFRPASTPIALRWLHTQPTRRTNVTFYNPDPVAASVTLTVTAADGSFSANRSVNVPAHSVAQLNDLFAAPPFDAVRSHNGVVTDPLHDNGTAKAAASASIVSSTRLYAVAWVISNQNNTVTISLPR
jgi:hypothetical protein